MCLNLLLHILQVIRQRLVPTPHGPSHLRLWPSARSNRAPRKKQTLQHKIQLEASVTSFLQKANVHKVVVQAELGREPSKSGYHGELILRPLERVIKEAGALSLEIRPTGGLCHSIGEIGKNRHCTTETNGPKLAYVLGCELVISGHRRGGPRKRYDARGR